jgi:hypothetical protein
MLYYFIFVMMPIRAAKQRRSGIAESRSGRSENTGERERWRGGAEAAEEWNRGVAQRTKRWRGGARIMTTAVATSTT